MLSSSLGFATLHYINFLFNSLLPRLHFHGPTGIENSDDSLGMHVRAISFDQYAGIYYVMEYLAALI